MKMKMKCKNSIIYSVLIVAIQMLLGCESKIRGGAIHDKSSSLAELKERAISGDGGAAMSLYQHFALYMSAPEDGIEWLIIGARSGDSDALAELKSLLEEGLSDEFLKKSFNLGGIEKLPNIYDSLRKDHLDFFEVSAEDGNSEAALFLYECFRYGDRFSDQMLAEKWLRRAVALGNENASVELKKFSENPDLIPQNDDTPDF
jgi:TPR repeat protein